MWKPPDFIVIGGQKDDKVFLIASKTLKHAELEEKTDWHDPFRHDLFEERRLGIDRTVITMSCEVNDYVIIMADSYSDAWQSLFEMWSPEPGKQKMELDSQRQLEALPKSIER